MILQCLYGDISMTDGFPCPIRLLHEIAKFLEGLFLRLHAFTCPVSKLHDIAIFIWVIFTALWVYLSSQYTACFCKCWLLLLWMAILIVRSAFCVDCNPFFFRPLHKSSHLQRTIKFPSQICKKM